MNIIKKGKKKTKRKKNYSKKKEHKSQLNAKIKMK
jgi:hypothetical protein